MKKSIFIVFALVLLLTIPMIKAESPVSSQTNVYDIAFAASTGYGETYATHLYVVRSDGTDLRQLSTTDGLPPVFSPDGQTIAYTDKGDLYLIQVDGTHKRLLLDNYRLLKTVNSDADYSQTRQAVPDIAPIYSLDWSNDGQTLFMLVDPSPGFSGSNVHLYKLDLNTSELSAIVKIDVYSPVAIWDFKVIPHHDDIIYWMISLCRNCDFSGGDIYHVNPDGSENQEISLPRAGWQYSRFAWSDTEQRLYYARQESYNQGETRIILDSWMIERMALDGTDITTVFPVDATDAEVIAAHETHLILHLMRGRTTNYYLADLETESIRPLCEQITPDNISVSPDGHLLAAQGFGDGLYVMDFDCHYLPVFESPGTYITLADWSPVPVSQ